MKTQKSISCPTFSSNNALATRNRYKREIKKTLKELNIHFLLKKQEVMSVLPPEKKETKNKNDGKRQYTFIFSVKVSDSLLDCKSDRDLKNLPLN